MADLPFNLFDILLGTILIGGLLQGRKHGLSVEFLSMLKWLVLVLICAALYRPIGNLLAETGFIDLLACYVAGYLGTALLIFLAFSILERNLKPKLAGSDIFGRSEYILGMGSGMLRFACILMVGLALLNARKFSPAELKNMEQFQEENYGSNIFPGLHSLQVAVFERSFIGGFIKDDLACFLIKPTLADEEQPRADAGRR